MKDFISFAIRLILKLVPRLFELKISIALWQAGWGKLAVLFR